MKNRCLRKTATLVYRVLLGGTVCEMIVLWLNRKYSEPWQLLFYTCISALLITETI